MEPCRGDSCVPCTLGSHFVWVRWRPAVHNHWGSLQRWADREHVAAADGGGRWWRLAVGLAGQEPTERFQQPALCRSSTDPRHAFPENPGPSCTAPIGYHRCLRIPHRGRAERTNAGIRTCTLARGAAIMHSHIHAPSFACCRVRLSSLNTDEGLRGSGATGAGEGGRRVAMVGAHSCHLARWVLFSSPDPPYCFVF